VGLAWLIAAVALGAYLDRHGLFNTAPSPHASDAYDFVGTLVDVRSLIQSNYVSKVSDSTLLDGAIRGMLQQLDPYSIYFSQEQWDQFDQETYGQFSGVGADIGHLNNQGPFVIITPLEDSPALKAGMMAGDQIVAIDSQSVQDWDLSQLLNAVSGAPGTLVRITVIHPGSRRPVTLGIRRALINEESVKGYRRLSANAGKWDYMIDPEHRIAYVRITTFMQPTPDQLDQALLPLLHSPGRLSGIILDLRFNPGGLLDSGVAVASRFISHGIIVSTRGRDGHELSSASADGNNTYPNVPMVVLVNAYTASAAEIVSGALQDYHRADIVGTRTYGKGSVQSVFPLNGGQTAIKLTIAHYFLPDGRNITRMPNATTWGINPDPGNVITLTPDQDQAVLEAFDQGEIIYPANQNLDHQVDIRLGINPPTSGFIDPQLQRALELLVEQSTRPSPATSTVSATTLPISTTR
jgi:carboxyl-terminal processing protease